MDRLTEEQVEKLEAFLVETVISPPHRYSFFRGFVFGLMYSPELLPPSVWIPSVIGSDKVFDDANEAQEFVRLALAVWKDFEALAEDGALADDEVWVRGGDPNDEDVCRAWSNGFAAAWESTQEDWNEVLSSFEPNDVEPFELSLFVLHFFSDKNLDQVSGEDDFEKSKRHAQKLFSEAVRGYSTFGVAIHQARRSSHPNGGKLYQPTSPIEAERLPGRNDPCPCGSGKKYKKCCLN